MCVLTVILTMRCMSPARDQVKTWPELYACPSECVAGVGPSPSSPLSHWDLGFESENES